MSYFIYTLIFIALVGIWVKDAIIKEMKITAAAYHKKHYGVDED